jgi:hypothetical protein
MKSDKEIDALVRAAHDMYRALDTLRIRGATVSLDMSEPQFDEFFRRMSEHMSGNNHMPTIIKEFRLFGIVFRRAE